MVFQPLRGWLISGCRFATPFVPATVILFFAASAFAAATNDLSNSQIEGRTLAQQLCNERPGTNATLTGTLKIRDKNGTRTEWPMKFEVVVTETNWTSIYEKTLPTNVPAFGRLLIEHDASSNRYEMTLVSTNHGPRNMNRSEVVERLLFAGDFLGLDLGLEFFHWPEQAVLKHEMRRGRSCRVLESTNPNPGAFPNLPDYSRVDSWIDNESGGIVHAEAYDVAGKLLKEFDPKSFKKVNGQWELEDMEIRNDQTGSRTRIEFDLDEK